jgi:hypothetical protein
LRFYAFGGEIGKFCADFQWRVLYITPDDPLKRNGKRLAQILKKTNDLAQYSIRWIARAQAPLEARGE